MSPIRIRWSLPTALFVLITVNTPTLAQTYVSGYHWGTWDLAGSPFVLNGTVDVPKCDPLVTDYDGDGEWDDAEDFDDYGLDGIPDTGDYGEGNGQYDLGEPYTDANGNGQWDPAEQYVDVDENGVWTSSYPPLDVDPNVIVRSTDDDWDIRVSGRLEMNGAYLELTGLNGSDYTTLYVHDGGEAVLTGCAISDSRARLHVYNGADLVLNGCTFSGGWVTYSAGSSGSVDGCDGTSWHLSVSSDGVSIAPGLVASSLMLAAPLTVADATFASAVTLDANASLLNCVASYVLFQNDALMPTVQGCELSSYVPLSIVDPDIDLSQISGNTYTHSTPAVRIAGTLDGAQTLGCWMGWTRTSCGMC